MLCSGDKRGPGGTWDVGRWFLGIQEEKQGRGPGEGRAGVRAVELLGKSEGLGNLGARPHSRPCRSFHRAKANG